MKEIQDEKDEYDFEDIKNTLDKGNIHNSLNFFFGDGNENFVAVCNLLGLNENNNNKEFFSFLCSDRE